MILKLFMRGSSPGALGSQVHSSWIQSCLCSSVWQCVMLKQSECGDNTKVKILQFTIKLSRVGNLRVKRNLNFYFRKPRNRSWKPNDTACILDTVETTRFAPLKLDSPPLIFIYCLPYENGKHKKIGFYWGHHSSFKWRLYEKGPTLGLKHIYLAL